MTFLCTVKQEEVLPRPADVQEDMLDDFWRSLHSILQLSALDKIINQSTAQGIMLGQFTSPVSEQLISWVSSRKLMFLLFPVLIMYTCALRMSCKCRGAIDDSTTVSYNGLKGLATMHFECVYVHVCACVCVCVCV